MSVIEYLVNFFKKAINELILCILSITKEIEFLFIPSDITIYNSNEIDDLYNIIHLNNLNLLKIKIL